MVILSSIWDYDEKFKSLSSLLEFTNFLGENYYKAKDHKNSYLLHSFLFILKCKYFQMKLSSWGIIFSFLFFENKDNIWYKGQEIGRIKCDYLFTMNEVKRGNKKIIIIIWHDSKEESTKEVNETK